MRKTEKRMITKEVYCTTDIICNNCGNSLKAEDQCNFDGLSEVEVCGEFGRQNGDLKTVIFSICEKCLIEIFDNFKIPPETNFDAD